MSMAAPLVAYFPVNTGDPLVCGMCEVVWQADAKAMRMRFNSGLSPALCPECFDNATLATRQKRAAEPLRCQCLGCGGHDGLCPERVQDRGARCRSCVQWELPEGSFEPGRHACAFCGMGTSFLRVVCRVCEAEQAAKPRSWWSG